ncbi:MAG: tetratricopeptide repeat protein [Candidatus Poribacteria bacterium]|nr:tetratricopeptide repeat protein [Candidatus Poribacteria bacterium]
MNPKILGVLSGLALVAVLFWPAGSSKKVERLYTEAEQLYSQNDYEGAIKKYGEALEESTKWGVKTEVIDKDFQTLADYKIAVSYSKWAEQSGDISYYDEAVGKIEMAAPNAVVPKHQEGLTYLWGHVLYKQEQYEFAEPKFQTLIENFPNSLFVENAWYAIGQLNYKLQRYDKSRQAYKKVLDGFPNSEFKDDAQHLIAQSFLNEKNYEQAYQEFDKLATEEFKIFPELQAEAMYKASFCLNQLARDEEAIGRYTIFITQFPDSGYVTAAYFDTGAIYSKQRDYDNARVNYELALQNTNDRELQAEIQVTIGRTYYDQEDYSNAVPSYNLLLEEYPESDFISEAKLGIADSYFKMESWSEASAAYQRVLDEHPDETDFIPYVTYQMGESYYKLASTQKESGQIDQANPNFEIALTWYQKAYDEFPTDPVAPHALYGAIWALNDLDRKDELEKVARGFIDKNRDDPEFDILSAEVQLKFADMKFSDFKQYDAAAVEYAKLWDYTPLPKFHLIKLIGKFQEARSYFEVAKPADYREGDPEAVFNEALLQKSINAYRQAIEMFKAEAFLGGVEDGRYDDFPQRPMQVEACRMNEALAHEKLNGWGEARQLYAAIPDTSENYERAQLLIAQSHVKEGNPAAAVTHYQSIMGSLSRDNRSLAEIKLADLLRSEGRFAEAATEYENVVLGNPTGEYADDAQYLVGLCYYKAASDDPALLERSVAAFQKAIDDYPDSPNAVESYYGLTLAYRDLAQGGAQEMWPKILETADLAYEKHSSTDDEKIKKTLGHIDLVKATAIEKQGLESPEQMAELVASLRRIAENTGAPEDSRSRAQLKIGHVYYGAGEHEKAIAEYQAFVQMFPNSELVTNALYQTSVSYYQIGQSSEDAQAKQLAFQNSANAATQVVERNPDVDTAISAYYTLGIAKSGLDDKTGAIEAFRKATGYEGQTEDEARQDLIYQAHSRLAELDTAVGAHASAVQEYQYVIQHTEEADLKGRSHFAMAYAQDEHLKQYDDALLNYQNAIQLAESSLIKAQAHYRMGLIYQTKLNDRENALKMYETLTSQFGAESDGNVQSMVADAGIRKSDLYVELGRRDDAIVQATAALKVAQTVPQKVSAQYNLGFLYFDQARSLFSDKPGTDLQPYIDAGRQSAKAYQEVANIAQPIEKADKAVIPFVQNALFQAGQIYYSLGTGIKLLEDLENATPPLQQFVEYTDKGIFPASDALSTNLQMMLLYLATTHFEHGRMQLGFDEGLSEKATGLFEKAAETFKDMARRFPKAKDAPLWQYQAGESYYAAQMYPKGIDEYEKVRQLNPQHTTAAESLAAISTCYSFLAEDSKDDPDVEAKWMEKVFQTNEVLAREYPSSPYAAEAFINLGNTYYNQGSDTDIEKDERIRLYQLAVKQYNRAISIPGIVPESKETAELYLRDTEKALSADVYIQATSHLDEAKLKRGDEMTPALQQTIAEFREIIKIYPNSKYGDLAYVQIGEAYMALAGIDDKYFNDALDSFDALWGKYGTVPPSDTQVNRALSYAQKQISDITEYMKSQGIERRAGGGGGE